MKVMDEVRYPPLVVAGVVAVCVLSCVAGFEAYIDTADYHAAQKDTFIVGQTFWRFAGAIPLLPRGEMVGYLTDLEPGSVQNTTAFLAAQYALAPNLLVSLDPRVKVNWVVGNYSQETDAQQTAKIFGMQVAKDFGNGVVVFRKGAR